MEKKRSLLCFYEFFKIGKRKEEGEAEEEEGGRGKEHEFVVFVGFV